jgi:hypothetical protein
MLRLLTRRSSNRDLVWRHGSKLLTFISCFLPEPDRCVDSCREIRRILDRLGRSTTPILAAIFLRSDPLREFLLMLLRNGLTLVRFRLATSTASILFLDSSIFLSISAILNQSPVSIHKFTSVDHKLFKGNLPLLFNFLLSRFLLLNISGRIKSRAR